MILLVILATVYLMLGMSLYCHLVDSALVSKNPNIKYEMAFFGTWIGAIAYVLNWPFLFAFSLTFLGVRLIFLGVRLILRRGIPFIESVYKAWEFSKS